MNDDFTTREVFADPVLDTVEDLMTMIKSDVGIEFQMKLNDVVVATESRAHIMKSAYVRVPERQASELLAIRPRDFMIQKYVQ